MALALLVPSVAFATPDDEALREHCNWLERAIAREPNRDDSFGMFMHGQRPKCQAFIEALGRGDGSVREDSLREVLKELKDLREVIDAEHGGPPPELPKAPNAETERKRAAEEAKQAEAERKRAAEEAKRAEAERKRAAEEAKRAADQARREEAERKRLGDQSQTAQRHADEADALRLIAEAEREAAREAPRDVGPSDTLSATPSEGLAAGLDGTWEQLETKVLDKWVKRTLNLYTRDGADGVIEGELYEEVWYPAPRAWRDTSCGGKETFRMVTSARVSGRARGARLSLSREVPRILTCTCGARCTVESRRRGMDLAIGAQGHELGDDSGVFLRPGAKVLVAPTGTSLEGGPERFAGAWETRAFKQRDRKVTQRVELTVQDGKLTGSLFEKSTQALPLESWSERFCDGARTWDWVIQWRVEGVVRGKRLELTGRDPSLSICTCPSKCSSPKAKLVLDGELGATGLTLELGEATFERR
jgi:hypothetical protein